MVSFWSVFRYNSRTVKTKNTWSNGLKIRYLNGCEGSNPSLGTTILAIIRD